MLDEGRRERRLRLQRRRARRRKRKRTRVRPRVRRGARKTGPRHLRPKHLVEPAPEAGYEVEQLAAELEEGVEVESTKPQILPQGVGA